MLDIGFSELLLTAVVALIVIGPKDLPVVLRHAAKYLRELRGFYFGVKKQMTAMMDEAGLTDMQREMTTIIDLEGKPQKAYDVRELEGLKMATSGATGAPLPAGEAGLLNEPKASFSNPGEGASTQAHAQPRPHPDLQPIASRSDWANPTSPAGRGDPAPPLQAKKP